MMDSLNMIPEFILLLPLWITGASAVIVLIMEAIFGPKGRWFAPWFSGIAISASLITDLVILFTPGYDGYLFSETVFIDSFAISIQCIGLISALFSILFSAPYLVKERAVTGEFYALLLFAMSGILTLAVASEFLTFFVGIELLSIPGYVLTGYFRIREKSAEAAMKYFLQGVFAAGFLLFGISILYGSSGSTFYKEIALAVRNSSSVMIPATGAVMLIAGLGFKVALVPFHGWAPDAYDGAASPITSFLSTGIKAAGFAALTRIFIQIFGFQGPWITAFVILSVLTMTIGNFAALGQRSVKRMLAYSSIAHAGYILVAFAVVDVADRSEMMHAISFYLLAYTFMTAGAFGFLSWSGLSDESRNSIEDFKGLGILHPVIAIAMTVFLFALAGFPPTSGFFAKYYVFKLAVDNGYIWLAVVGVLNSFISAYYYLRVIVYMYMKPVEESTTAALENPAFSIRVALSLATACVFLVSLIDFSY